MASFSLDGRRVVFAPAFGSPYPNRPDVEKGFTKAADRGKPRVSLLNSSSWHRSPHCTFLPWDSTQILEWDVIADNLSKVGWSWGCVAAIDFSGRTIWIADAHCDDGNRFVVRADES